jgi:signal transduction histidine kinase
MIAYFSILALLVLIQGTQFANTARSEQYDSAALVHASDFLTDKGSALPDTALINRLNTLAEVYSKKNSAAKDTASLYAARAFALAEKIGYKRGMAEALAGISYRLNIEGKIEQGLEKGFKGLHLAEELGDERLIARGLINIGFAAGQQSHSSPEAVHEARERLLKALSIANSLHDDYLICISQNTLGRLARIEGKLPEGLAYHEQALVLARRVGNPEMTSWALHGIAIIYEMQKRYPEALKFAQEALALREATGLGFAIATSLRLVGYIHFHLGHFAEARRYAERSIAVSKNLDGLFLVKVQAYQLLSDTYNALKKPYEALRWYKAYIAMRDSAFQIESKNNIVQLQAQIDRERKDREEAVRIRDRQLQEERFQRQRIIGIVIITCLLLLSVAVALLWRTNRLRNKQNEELLTANEEIKTQQEILEAQSQEIEITNTQLQETNETLSASNAALDEANTFKLNMLSIAAHDLKNPIHTIGNFAELLKEEPVSAGSNVAEYAERISRICARMLALIHDLLDTAAHDLGKMNLQMQPVNLSDLAIAVADQYTPQAVEKEQRLRLESAEDCWVEGDVQRLYQVLENLLSNAVKYSPWGKNIWLTISIPHEQDSVRLSVKDEGPGMTADDQEKAFVMFQR